MLQCIAIDDEPLGLDIIKEYAARIDFIALNKTFISTIKAKIYLSEYPVDLIFLDIQMPGINGMEFYRSLPNKPLVIFTTAYRQFAVDGFTVDAVDYLLKPIEMDRFMKAAKKANEICRFEREKNCNSLPYLFIRSGYQLVKIMLADILYIEGLNDYVKIIIANGPPQLSLTSMKDIMDRLPYNQFTRVHRSFIIPFSRITGLSSTTVFVGKKAIPIGDTYKEKVRTLLGPK